MTVVDVVLDGAGPDGIRVVRVLAAELGIDLIASMDLVDRAPVTALVGVDSARAEALAGQLRAVGAQVTVAPSLGSAGGGATVHEAVGPATPVGGATTRESASGGPVGFRRTALLPALATRFSVVRDLDGGGEADVLLSRDDAGHEWVVKQYRQSGWAADEEVLRRLAAARDGQSLAAWRTDPLGASLLWVQEWGTDPATGLFYEVAEYVPGGALSLRDGVGVTAIVEGLVGAVATFHAAVGAHRDVKPANLLVRQSQPLRLVLADVGLSRALDGSKRYSKRDGSAAYQAPEAAQGLVSRAGDWWSVGMIVAQAALGYHPLALPDGSLPPDPVILTELAQRDVPHLDRITDDRLRLLCQGLLTRDADRRWSLAQVREWQQGETPAVPGWGRAQAPGRAPGRVRKVLFNGTDYDTPEGLAEAFAADPDGAGRLLFQERDQLLLDDLRMLLSAAGLQDALVVLDGYQSGGWETTFLRLLAEMHPALPPNLFGVAITPAAMAEMGARILESGQETDSQLGAISWVISHDPWRIWRNLPGMLGSAAAHERMKAIAADWNVSHAVGRNLDSTTVNGVYITFYCWMLRQAGDPDTTTPMYEWFLDRGRTKWPDVGWWQRLSASPDLPDKFKALATIEIAARDQRQVEAERAEADRRRAEAEAEAEAETERRRAEARAREQQDVDTTRRQIRAIPIRGVDLARIDASDDPQWLRLVLGALAALSKEQSKSFTSRDRKRIAHLRDELRGLGAGDF